MTQGTLYATPEDVPEKAKPVKDSCEGVDIQKKEENRLHGLEGI